MGGTSDAEQASQNQSRLFKQYAAAGLPALQNAQGYTRSALNIGEPAYVRSAFGQAAAGAESEGLGAELATRGRLAAGLGGTGALAGAVGASAAAGGASVASERSGIATTRALTQVDSKNKLLSILAGQGASGTNLAAGFGSLTNQGLGIAMRAGNPAMQIGSGLGALGASTYLDYAAASNRRNASMFDPSAQYLAGQNGLG